MQKGVQKTEEMLVKVKQYFSGSSCVQHLAHLTSIILTGKHNHWYWRSGFGPNGGQVMLSSNLKLFTKPNLCSDYSLQQMDDPITWLRTLCPVSSKKLRAAGVCSR